MILFRIITVKSGPEAHTLIVLCAYKVKFFTSAYASNFETNFLKGIDALIDSDSLPYWNTEVLWSCI